jgi:TPR repeat protein
VDVPNSLYYIEAEALFNLGEALASRDRLLAYLSSEGREGRYYDKATQLLLKVKFAAAQQEKLLKEEAARRQVKLAENEQKARLMHLREAQERLHELGFWLGPPNGAFDLPTREAIAIFQVRRNLQITGDINDELIAKLRSESPDSHECDTLVGSPQSPLAVERPISQLSALAAVDACNKALRKYPDVVRFQIQYARALLAADRNPDALRELQNGSDLGYPRAFMLRGFLYEDGRLSEKGKPDYANALAWYRAAAEKSYPEAQLKIGDFYLAGNGVDRSDTRALQWYLSAAEQSYAPGQVAVGSMFEAGRGTSRDYPKAIEWFDKAVDNGNGEAMFRVGKMYERGRGVKRNKSIAEEWYAKAAGVGYRAPSSSRSRR